MITVTFVAEESKLIEFVMRDQNMTRKEVWENLVIGKDIEICPVCGKWTFNDYHICEICTNELY